MSLILSYCIIYLDCLCVYMCVLECMYVFKWLCIMEALTGMTQEFTKLIHYTQLVSGMGQFPPLLVSKESLKVLRNILFHKQTTKVFE